MDGDRGEDIVLGGYTLWDHLESALWSMQQEWISNGSYESRTANLGVGTGTGLNGAVRLVGNGAQQTVFGDGQADRLKGSRDRDWFFAENLGAFPDRLGDWNEDEAIVFVS